MHRTTRTKRATRLGVIALMACAAAGLVWGQTAAGAAPQARRPAPASMRRPARR